jgi:hypothetical protein
MSTNIEQLDGGKYRVKYDTGEVFEGDPLDVLNKIGDAHQSTKKWAQNIRAENENLKNQALNPPPPPPQPQATNADEAALQNYLLDQQAKALGFSNGAEYRARLDFVNQTTDQVNNNLIAESFMSSCPDFPNTGEAIESLARKVASMGWEFNQQSLMAAHLMCIRQGEYRPLTPEEVNSTWSANMAVASGAKVPPTPPSQQAPGQTSNQDPWQMSQDELRKKVLEGGGLGKLLMDLPPGGSL